MGRLRLILPLIGCAGVGVVLLLLLRDREPEYKGRTLSQWLFISSVALSGDHQPTEAVSHIGTNALPWLIKWVQYDEPQWKQHFLSWIARRHSASKISRLERALFNRYYYIGPIAPGMAPNAIIRRDRSQFEPAKKAQAGFKILGTNGAPAIPELARIARDRRRPSFIRAAAVECLRDTGSDALPVLAQISRDSDPFISFAAWSACQDLTPRPPYYLER